MKPQDIKKKHKTFEKPVITKNSNKKTVMTITVIPLISLNENKIQFKVNKQCRHSLEVKDTRVKDNFRIFLSERPLTKYSKATLFVDCWSKKSEIIKSSEAF